MSAPLLVALCLSLIATVHRMPLHRAAPPTAVAVWMLALTLRALVAVVVAAFAFTQLAHASAFEQILGWCWHEVLPHVPGRFGFAEHPVAHSVVVVPLAALTVALATQALEVVRARVSVHRSLAAGSRPGPLGTTVIHDDAVVIAVTRHGHGRVVVSERALELMDESELAAGVAHEAAHLRRGHRPVLLVAAVLARIARPLPGTAAAEREVTFHLERDADADAVRRLHDPLSLASAICKAATSGPRSGFAGLSGTGVVSRRLAELVGEGGGRSRPVELAARGVAAILVGLALAAGAGTPAWALQAPRDHGSVAVHRCDHLR